MADGRKRGRSTDINESQHKLSPKKARISLWTDNEVLTLLSIMKEETIMHNLDNAKTPKEKRSAYKYVAVKLEQKGIPYAVHLSTLAYFFCIWNPKYLIRLSKFKFNQVIYAANIAKRKLTTKFRNKYIKYNSENAVHP